MNTWSIRDCVRGGTPCPWAIDFDDPDQPPVRLHVVWWHPVAGGAALGRERPDVTSMLAGPVSGPDSTVHAGYVLTSSMLCRSSWAKSSCTRLD